GPEAARAFVAPFVTGVFAADAHDVSLEAGFPRLAALEDAGGLVRGFAKQAVQQVLARATGRPAVRTPRGLWAPVGGLGMLVDALAKALGARVRSGVRVQAVAPAERGVLVDGERWDAAVLATPAAEAAAMTADAMP